jgi:hypothetical protein
LRNLVFFCFLVFTPIALANTARVAIVIDDIGYRITDEAALSLPGNITYSVLPHTPFGKRLAERAYQADHDVLLHIPMEAENGKKLGPGGITHDMNEHQIRATLSQSFAEIPFAIGINNHMGSLLTQLPEPMQWTMKFLKERDVLFLDSMTTQASKAHTIAQQYHVPTLTRSVFLDNELTPDYIKHQFQQLIILAKQKQQVIAIAHPHPETVAVLKQLLPQLAEHNIQLVPLSTLLDTSSTHYSLAATEE